MLLRLYPLAHHEGRFKLSQLLIYHCKQRSKSFFLEAQNFMSLALISESVDLPNYIVLNLSDGDARPEAPRIFILLKILWY